jgi:hypothetical protein
MKTSYFVHVCAKASLSCDISLLAVTWGPAPVSSIIRICGSFQMENLPKPPVRSQPLLLGRGSEVACIFDTPCNAYFKQVFSFSLRINIQVCVVQLSLSDNITREIHGQKVLVSDNDTVNNVVLWAPSGRLTVHFI